MTYNRRDFIKKMLSFFVVSALPFSFPEKTVWKNVSKLEDFAYKNFRKKTKWVSSIPGKIDKTLMICWKDENEWWVYGLNQNVAVTNDAGQTYKVIDKWFIKDGQPYHLSEYQNSI